MLTWDQVRERLDLMGYTQRRVARRFRISESAASRFLNAELHSARLRRLLANLLGVDLTEIPDAERCPTCHQTWRQAG